MPEKKKIDRVVNVSGLLCPRPNLITTKVLEDMSKGETLEVVSTDKNTRKGISSLCQKGKYILHEIREEHGQIIYVIEKQ